MHMRLSSIVPADFATCCWWFWRLLNYALQWLLYGLLSSLLGDA